MKVLGGQDATQQGAVPDRVQLRSSSLLATLPAAGEAERFDLTAEELVQDLRNA